MKRSNFQDFSDLKSGEIQESSRSSRSKILKIGLGLTTLVNLTVALADEPTKPPGQPQCHFTPSPAMPARALRDGIGGVVVTKFTIAGGDVKDIVIESGPRVFYDVVKDALQRYKCSITDVPVRTGQSFNFDVPSSSKRRVISLADGRQYHGETSNDGVMAMPEVQGIEYEASGKIRRQGVWREGELFEQREVNQYLYRFIPPPQKGIPPPPPPPPPN